MKKHNAEKVFLDVQQAIEQGADSVTAVTKATGYGYSIIKRYSAKRIKLPIGKRGRKIKRIANRNEMIMQGYTQAEIGIKEGITRQGVRDYIMRNKLYDKWKQAKKQRKKEKPRKKTLRKEILKWIIKSAYEKAKAENNFAWQKTFEYIALKQYRLDNDSIPCERLVKLFEEYEKAGKRNEKATLTEIAENALWNVGSASRVLNAVGLREYKKRNRQIKISKEKTDAIEKGFDLELSAEDIAYFLNVSSYRIKKRYAEKGKRKVKKVGNKIGTCKKASQIYEAEDSDFSNPEIAELVNCKEEDVEYAINNRNRLEEKIVHALNVLYPLRKKRTKPYLS